MVGYPRSDPVPGLRRGLRPPSEAGLYGTISETIAAIGFPYVGSDAVAAVPGLLVLDPDSLWVLQDPAAVASGMTLVLALVSTM